MTTLRARRSSDTQGEVSKILARLESAGQDNAVLALVANSDVVFKPFVAMASALSVPSAKAFRGPHADDFHGRDFDHFGPGELHAWRGGLWRHEWHDGRFGWWWGFRQ